MMSSRQSNVYWNSVTTSQIVDTRGTVFISFLIPFTALFIRTIYWAIVRVHSGSA